MDIDLFLLYMFYGPFDVFHVRSLRISCFDTKRLYTYFNLAYVGNKKVYKIIST